jgi:terminase small subunit-like protein
LARPTISSPELAESICAQFAEGKTLRSICSGMPSVWTVIRWRREKPEFAALFSDAQESYEQVLFDEMLVHSGDRKGDWVEKKNGRGDTFIAVDYDHINRSKLEVETRAKILAKLNPQKFGDRQQIDSTVEASVKVEREPPTPLESAQSAMFTLTQYGLQFVPAGAQWTLPNDPGPCRAFAWITLRSSLLSTGNARPNPEPTSTRKHSTVLLVGYGNIPITSNSRKPLLSARTN